MHSGHDPTESRWLRLIAASLVFAGLSTAGCVKPEPEPGSCGRNAPGCFEDEACVCGECIPESEEPFDYYCRADDTETPDAVDGDSSPPPDTEETSDGGDADTGPPRVCFDRDEQLPGVCRGLFQSAGGATPVCRDVPRYTTDETSPEDCDGFDNDCDGEVDEGCPCPTQQGVDAGRNDDALNCYEGRPEHAGHGICRWGTLECGDNDQEVVGCEGGDTFPREQSYDADADTNCDG